MAVSGGARSIRAMTPTEIPVLNHGYVALVDVMGDDRTAARCARTSYRNAAAERSVEDDAKLTRYLVTHKHTTPLEFCQLRFYMKMPIFVARQLVRHRTACLGGDTLLHFDLPGGVSRRGNQRYSRTIKQIVEAFEASDFARRRIRGMLLRCVDEDVGEITWTHITNAWRSGKKHVYDVTLANGFTTRMSKDHRVYTDRGWLRLHEIMDQPIDTVRVGVSTRDLPEQAHEQPVFSDEELRSETWRATHIAKYEVSSLGRVRSLLNTQGASRAVPLIKLQTPTPGGHLVVSLSEDGISRTSLVHHLVLHAFVGGRPPGAECCHVSGDGFDNRATNLRWGSAADNANDRKTHDAVTRLRFGWQSIKAIKYAGVEETYDIEVSGPWHNFVANGMVVHNSINELSLRYVKAADEFYVPDVARCQRQSTTNKQGSADAIVDNPAAVRAIIQGAGHDAFMNYERLLTEGLAKELARTVLPLGTYTEWYWQTDLHNFLHMCKLRLDPHAQYEIRVYAQAMLDLARPHFPTAISAWEGAAT